jgi:CheY-like chemotaxis protein
MGSAAPQGGSCAVVLVVDDEEYVCEYMARILREAGYQVRVAHDGLQALGIVESYGGALDLVVTDVTMPRVTGTELAARIKQRWPGLPILYVTGRHLPEDAPAAPFLQKPFTPDALTSQARALLAASH